MILKMEKLSAFALLADKDDILNSLMREQCVQLSAPEAHPEYEELRKYTAAASTDLFTAEQKLGRYNAALNGMSFYITKKGLFAWKPRILYDKLEDGEMLAAADALCDKVEGLLSQMADIRAGKSKDLFLKASLEPWAQNDLELAFDSTRDTSVKLYLLPAKTDTKELEAKLAEAAPASYIEYVSSDREQMYLCTVCHRAQEAAFWDVLKLTGASRAAFTGLTGTARQNIAAVDKRVAEYDAEIARLEDCLRDAGKDVFPLQYGADVLSVRIQRGRANDELLHTQKTFCFTGWVPETAKEKAIATLEKYGCYYEFAEPSPEEEPPILLKNSQIFRPFESITQMYSLPTYRGLDPGMAIAPFFFIFFGMMLSDAGYGLLLLIGGAFMLKKMDLGANAKKLIAVIAMGGISTIFWGALYGSWFGDIIPVAAGLFGIKVTIPALLDPLSDPMTILILSLALGVVHLLVGMGLKGYMLLCRKQYLDALFDVGFFFIAFFGVPLLLLGGVPGTVGMVMAVGGCIGMVATAGRENKSFAGKIAGGLFGLYQTVTGTFSDILSYSRILALGLATGVIGSVVNLMGSLMGPGIVGILVLAIVFVFGHALNLAINALGSYVHTSRLQYVEFFGKFYEGGGKPFTPFQPITKYIHVLNEEEK